MQILWLEHRVEPVGDFLGDLGHVIGDMFSNEGINHDTCGICIQKIQELARFETFVLGIHFFFF